jgi:tetratricopeptide (TPR) repeat protein
MVKTPAPHLLQLPEAPAHLTGPVKAWRQPVSIETYTPQAPTPNPMFLETRVYQGSSGRVYPLPFFDRIATEPVPRLWDALHIENDFIRVMVLPELGGRIHIGYDKIAGYDFFYRQNVIKPALVGLAGPWASGGVEFNWPQHHRPATFMPVETEIEHHADGSATLWCSDHDPMQRMKGMHGVRLYPDRALLELNVRLFNRTRFTQTFLWWANVAARVHGRYQSFFPPDVGFVADHAKRAITRFALSDRPYYGVDYPARVRDGVPDAEQPAALRPDGSYPANDLSWYANIPVPTSYMAVGSEADYFGGYDHARQAGLVHVANHHIAPGKKQWTWGNQEFGYAWDRSLTEADGPYIELMAGVYTDNQPDFSFLAPWETKAFTQTWIPIHAIGIPRAANEAAAVSLTEDNGEIRIGLQVTQDMPKLEIALRAGGAELMRWPIGARAGRPLFVEAPLPASVDPAGLAVTVYRDGQILIAYDPAKIAPARTPAAAQEPPLPKDVASVEELYLTGLHLEQYRHATRRPEAYWQEALRRDPDDSRVNNAMGLWHLQRGEFDAAAEHLGRAVARLTRLNPNPRDGEPYYNLGLVQRLRGEDKQAYDAFYKATWNAAWRAPAYLGLAEIDGMRGDWERARDNLLRSLAAEADNLNARNLLVVALDRLGRHEEARQLHLALRALDALDVASRWHAGIEPATAQDQLDLTFDMLRAGRREEALRVLTCRDEDRPSPMLLFVRAMVEAELGRGEAYAVLENAEKVDLTLCFPSRLEEMQILQRAIAVKPDGASAHYLLGNFLYDRRRHQEAIHHWREASRLRPDFPTVWRNLGIALFNVLHDAAGARAAFDRAAALAPSDGRILYERDQLWKKLGERPERRLQELELYHPIVAARDDLSVERATLLNRLGRSAEALDFLLQRQFQPWEGGEGLVLAQYVRAHLKLGQTALVQGMAKEALAHFQAAKQVPHNLGEARHPLASQSDIAYWIAEAHAALGDPRAARAAWEEATRRPGDFQQMAVQAVSDMTHWAARAQLRLGHEAEARSIFEAILSYADELERSEPRVDYFATSLPNMLLFTDDLGMRNRIMARLLRAQAFTGLNRAAQAEEILKSILADDCNNIMAADLLEEINTSGIGDRSHA